jgi:group I intron endonuclease
MINKPYGYIYKIACKINDKVYVGQTIRTIPERWRGHKWKASRPSKEHDMAITRAIHKYGPDNFTIIAVCSADNQEELDEKEKFYIREFDSINNGYNLHEGGLGQRISEETKIKMSIAGKGKKKPLGFGDKIKKARTGTVQPEIVKLKCSLSQKGKKSAWFGKKHTEETKKKIGIHHKGKVISEEQKAKQSMAMKGRKISEETKKKMSLARRGRKPNQKALRCMENEQIYVSIKEAAAALGISLNSLRAYLRGKLKSAQNFHFEYV